MITNLNRGSRHQRHADQSPESVLPHIASGRSSPLYSPHNRSSEQELVQLHSQNAAPHESENHRLLLPADEGDNSAAPTRSTLLECFKSLREKSGLPCFKKDIELFKPSEHYTRFEDDKSMLDGLDETHTGRAIKDVLKMVFATKNQNLLEDFKNDMPMSEKELEKVDCMCDLIDTLKKPITETVPIKRQHLFKAIKGLGHRYKVTTEESDPAKKATNFDKMSLTILNQSGLETAKEIWGIYDENNFNDKPISFTNTKDIDAGDATFLAYFTQSNASNASEKKMPLIRYIRLLQYTIGIKIKEAQKQDQAAPEETKTPDPA